MKSIADVNFKDKKVLIRCDFNVPLDKSLNITDNTRIRESLPTIQKVLADGAAVILMSHLGRPKEIGYEHDFSLTPIAAELSKLLHKDILFAPDIFEGKTVEAAKNLLPGQILLLENLRFLPGEQKGDPVFAQFLASLGNVYINDAFGTAHRAHASTAIIADYFPQDKYFGFLMEKEVRNLEKLLNHADKPFTAIIGGSKVSTKIDILKNLIPRVDNLIIGGGMSYTFAKAMGGKIGNSICENDKLDLALEIVESCKQKNVKLYMAIDTVAADNFSNEANKQVVPLNEIPDGWEGLDIGPKTITSFMEVIAQSQTILWNGPVGVFEMENFRVGSKAITEAVAAASTKGVFTAVGGGDSIACVNMFGLADKISYISTGGGAMLEYLEGKTLPGVKAILS